MPSVLEKLRPDTDLQVYFERPTAIAAISEAAANGFKVSGTWRQQFDWCVVEWSRYNVFEHPAFRSLPDGDLSGLTLTYDETRTNCIPMDSSLYATVDWPSLRIWTRDGDTEDFYKVALRPLATAIEGSYVAASAAMTLTGSVTPGDYVGFSFFEEHHTYQALGADTLADIVTALASSVNTFSTQLTAVADGETLRLTLADATLGLEGNMLGVYGFSSDARTEVWSPSSAQFSGGQSPTKWRVTIDFSNLTAIDTRHVPAQHIRKMRWTYAAALQPGQYERSEFQVAISNWTVTGSNRRYQVAGKGSVRVEDDDSTVQYTGTWPKGIGNFSGSTIHSTTSYGAKVTAPYFCGLAHTLYLGTRYAENAAAVEVRVDGALVHSEDLAISQEDILCRIPLGTFAAGSHTVELKHADPGGGYVYFDFVEAAVPTETLPTFPVDNKVTLATDWDTDHSIAIAAERTAWMLHSLGFHGRANHYVGALWFYELTPAGYLYASATVDFVTSPFSATSSITIGRVGDTLTTTISHVNRAGETPETLARAYAMELNRGFTAVWAEASGSRLTIHARAIGLEGNDVTVAVSPSSGSFRLEASGTRLAGGLNGDWRTDLTAVPRLNRACRDWSREFYRALHGYGIDVTAAYSTELQHGDPSLSAGIAQRYPNGDPVLLNTPALQTNFSPASLAYWREVHKETAGLMADVGLQPYLQFGEVQWWYFPNGSGMTFYDDYTKAQFEAAYGHPMAVIASEYADPASYPDEVAFLPTLIGSFTNAIMSYVRTSYSTTRFEVLYPTDVNNTALNRLINYPAAAWTPAILDNLKNESFTFTYGRNLDLSRITVTYGDERGFPRSKRSFLVGVGDASAPWIKEVAMAKAEGLESIVLFALDQYCLVGYATPISTGSSRSAMMG
ncbi:MAG: hypothetical protein U0Q16_11680 [Bryobacteraceae bacterium]